MFRTSIGSAISDTPLRRRIQRTVGIPRSPFYSAMLSLTGMLLFAFFIVVVLGPLGISGDSALLASENGEATQAFKPQPGDLLGEWETEMDGNQLKILVYGRKSSGMSYVLAPDQVADLIDQEQRPFQIVRDAGALFLEGRLEELNGKVNGSGDWYFRPDTAYVHFMSRYGLPENDRQKVLSFAIFDISREYLRELRDAGYADVPYDRLLSMRIQGVTADDAREFERLGCRQLTPDELISARIHGITTGFVKSFRDAGFADLSYKSFVSLRAFNLDVDDLEDCFRHRFMDLSEDNVVWVCGFGITRKDIEKKQKLGYTDIDSIISILAKEHGR